MMRIVMIGIGHRTAAVALRERVAIAQDALGDFLAKLRGESANVEAVVLSTCNRTEIYVARPTHESPDADRLRELVSEHSGIAVEELTAVAIQREQDRAALHLFRVCGGLDSMVLGEPQILGQVKRAYQASIDHQSIGPVLHKLFQDAIKAGKRLRHETGIGEGRLSIGSVAVDFARQVFDHFEDKTVIAVGAGEMGKVTVRHFLALKPGRLWLVNRSHHKALALAEQLQLPASGGGTSGRGGASGGARAWEDLDDLLVEADVLVTCTGATQPILTAKQFKPLVRKRRRRPLFVLDLAVPRDVEPEVGSLANVYLYNVDDLQSVIAENHEGRRELVEACEQQLAEGVGRCMMSIQHRDLGQLIRQLRTRLHDIGDMELERTMRKVTAMIDASDGDAIHQIIAEHTQRVINKVLHLPLSQIDERDPEAPLGFYAAALRRLFDLEESGEPDAQRIQRVEKIEK